MGVSVMYSAIPPKSPLYKKLKNEKRLSILFNDLFVYGSGIFSFFEIESEEVDEILSGVFEAHEDIFDSADMIDEIISEFQSVNFDLS